MRALVLCAGAARRAAPKHTFDQVERLSTRGTIPNLRIEQLDPKLLSSMTDVQRDLVELGAYVYGADRLVSRGGKDETARDWVRDLSLVVPLRASVWRSRDVRSELEGLLSFLTGDRWHLMFPPATWKEDKQTALIDDVTFRNRTCVSLFSGGLDSLVGAVWDRSARSHRPLLVSHRSHSKVSSRQTELVRRLREADPDTVHLQAWVQLVGTKDRDVSQRSRSFLFLSLAGALADLFAIPVVHVFENGPLSINVPIAPQVVGTEASRTTHPRFIHEMQHFLRTVLGNTVIIDLPFLSMTKAEVVQLLADLGRKDLVALSSSCTHPMWQKQHRTHCGACSQCIDRRFAVEKCGLLADDPTYELDLFTTPLDAFPDEAEARSLIEGYIRTFGRIGSLPPEGILETYPETYDLIPYVADVREVAELYARQAQVVVDVIDYEIATHRAEIRQGTLAENCALRTIIAGELAREPTRRFAERIGVVAGRALPIAFSSQPATDERAVQTALEVALSGEQEKLDREFPQFAYVFGLGARPDFSGRRTGVLLEVKYIRGTARSRAQITREVMQDIATYSHRAHGTVFVVFDPERQIADDERYREDLETHPGVFVVVAR